MATVPEVSHFQWHVFLSYRCTTYRWTVLGPTVVWSYYGKKIKWPRFWLWKKSLVQRQQFPRSFIFKGTSFYRTVAQPMIIRRKDVLCLDFEKRPCTTATVPKVSHFQGHHLILSSKVIDLKAVTDAVRGEGHADLAQRKAGRRCLPLPHHRQWLFWPFSLVLAHGKKSLHTSSKAIASYKKESLLSIVAS